MTQIPYKEPQFEETSFNCPFCNAFAKQTWRDAWFGMYSSDGGRLEETRVCFCEHCKMYSIWFDGKMIFPDYSAVEAPNQDLNEDIRADYREAANILQKSPRGAAALLRLAVQKLCVQLGEKGKDINADIQSLVAKGLPSKIQQSLDAVRVIGNEAVHPGQLDLKDDVQMASSLFRLLNIIAEKMITEPRQIDEIYAKIPETKKDSIEKRDGKK